MDASTVMQAIGSLGFPIVACCAMFWLCYQQNKSHCEESSQMREAINELKLAINTLVEKLDN